MLTVKSIFLYLKLWNIDEKKIQICALHSDKNGMNMVKKSTSILHIIHVFTLFTTKMTNYDNDPI